MKPWPLPCKTWNFNIRPEFPGKLKCQCCGKEWLIGEKECGCSDCFGRLIIVEKPRKRSATLKCSGTMGDQLPEMGGTYAFAKGGFRAVVVMTSFATNDDGSWVAEFMVDGEVVKSQ